MALIGHHLLDMAKRIIKEAIFRKVVGMKTMTTPKKEPL
jgi:hypothetical protein